MFVGLVLCLSTVDSNSQNLLLERNMNSVEGCNEYVVDLQVTGVPDDIPQEVVLLIDRSGSMALDIPGDDLEPMDYAKDAAIYFIENLFSEENNPTGMNRVAVISYSIYAWANYGFAGSDEKEELIEAVNSLFASGGTNISMALNAGSELMKGTLDDGDIYNDISEVPGDLDGASLDCITSRSFVLLSDGVTNRRFLNNVPCTSNPTPPFPQNSTDCMTDAIEKGQEALVIETADGEFEQSIYSVGLLGALSGNAEEAAIFTLDQIQNKGLYLTESAAELMEIYDDILGQLPIAAYDATLIETIPAGFELVDTDFGSEEINYDEQLREISWNIGDIGSQNFQLSYNLTLASTDLCGSQAFEQGKVEFTDVFCQETELQFPNNDICIPCLNMSDLSITQPDCSSTINYSADLDMSGCEPFLLDYQWQFYLNEDLIETIPGQEIDQLSGSYSYPGDLAFSGQFKVVLIYEGTYDDCFVAGGSEEVTIILKESPEMPLSMGDQVACDTGQAEITLYPSAEVADGMSLRWYLQAVGGENITDPSWSDPGMTTFYAETYDPVSGCVSDERTAINLTIYSCGISLDKQALDVDPDNCNAIQAGQMINYRFNLQNIGNVPLDQVRLTDFLIAADQPLEGPLSGDTNSDERLDPDETWVFEAAYLVQAEDVTAGEVINQALVEAHFVGTEEIFDLNSSDQEIVALCNRAEMRLEKCTVDQPTSCFDLVAGDQIDYEFSLTNTGDLPIFDIDLMDPLIPELSALPFAGDESDPGILNPGERWYFRGSYVLSQEDLDRGYAENTAFSSGTSAQGRLESVSNTVQSMLCSTGEIALVKKDLLDQSAPCPLPGQKIGYEFTVVNTGQVTLSEVALSDPMLGGEISGPISGDVNQDGQLNVDEQWTYEARYSLSQEDIDYGAVVNQASVIAKTPNFTEVNDESGTSLQTDDPTITDICQQAAVVLVMTSEYNQTEACSQVGEPIAFSLQLSNTGNQSMSNVVVNDPLLGGELAGPDSGDTDSDGLLNIDETWIYTATYTITQDDIEVGTVTNQATVTATAPDQTVVGDISGSTVDTDEVTVTDLCQDPSIALIKTVSLLDLNENGCADPGETLQYNFRLANTGNVTLFEVSINDPLAAVNGEAISLLVGEENSSNFTADYVITAEDMAAGLVINQAEVTAVDISGNMILDFSDDDDFAQDDPTVFEGFCAEDEQEDEQEEEQEEEEDKTASFEVEMEGRWMDNNNNGNSEVDEEVRFQVTVSNTGDSSLFDIQLGFRGPGLSYSGGPIEELPPGTVDEDTFVITYLITESDLEALMVEAQIEVIATDEYGNEIRVLSDDPNDPTNRDLDGDGNPDDPTVVILPRVLNDNSSQPTFEIFNAISPDGDGLNDFMVIQGIEDYPQNNFKVFNRWGVQVFEVDGYDNNSRRFEGISEGRTTIQQGKRLPSGTYYYVLTFPGDNPGQSAYQGYLYINRN
ncbi:DUF7507 domain-containing protein [Aureitalea marina]|uniref:VWFA domain-containing protein n=1 Tax=Aureitalea marina TaxID=930804 RepID=A0A2S7KQC9_9FLAO|nr:gliding motility-associated C-terminal domain-containing protein [Aureitalea marina]PQB04807.1 hypothetical protein BST85_07770 [Aureitalea marina]